MNTDNLTIGSGFLATDEFTQRFLKAQDEIWASRPRRVWDKPCLCPCHVERGAEIVKDVKSNRLRQMPDDRMNCTE